MVLNHTYVSKLMGNYKIPVDDVDKASKWTAFFLVDLKIVFIITFVYVSVVNLVSTTANNEASTDVNSNSTFTVTTKHGNVNVSFIDDAILWNCRDHSETKRYYQILYWMLIVSFGLALVTLTIVKWNILCNAMHGHTYLWYIAVVNCIRNSAGNTTSDEATTKAKLYRKLLETECNINVPKGYNRCRLLTLFINSCIIPFAIFLSFTTYDLHPLSCISEQGDNFIEYTRMPNNMKGGTVEIQFPDWIKIYRIVAIIALFILGLGFLINILCFYVCNFRIIEKLETQVKIMIEEKTKQKR